jgi:predicted RNA polymerase sigma factor
MHLHFVRLPARLNDSNELLLLEEQDRVLWDKNHIQQGLYWLSKSSDGDEFSRYHAEAGIAVEHCLAGTFEETRWDKVVNCYELLEKTTSSALHRLNKIIAIAQWKGADVGLAELHKLDVPKWLLESFQYYAVLSDLNRRCGNLKDAEVYAINAIEMAPTPAIKNLLHTRLNLI